ncbi:CAP domain-containing protein [Candidatus Solincola tengchongensis]|uniref:CAP domain-containing protein n=1 Tax=Candidatus Solincola tengchongensis TaxID=2900693 RepID=UPI00257BA3DB|nr:CAP domain-containing protein [Candidatus Solincola tengchongensis]
MRSAGTDGGSSVNGGFRPRRRFLPFVAAGVIIVMFLAAVLGSPGCGCLPVPRQQEVSLEYRVERTAEEQSREPEGLFASADLEEEKAGHISHIRDNSLELAYLIHRKINDVRKRYGLSALSWDQELAAIALEHSRDMAERDYFDHVSPEGKDFTDRYREHGYKRTTRVGTVEYKGGENLFLGNVVKSYTYDRETGEILSYSYFTLEGLAEAAVNGWMESPGHRENILTPFSREGIGVWVDDDGEVYVTQNFS